MFEGIRGTKFYCPHGVEDYAYLRATFACQRLELRVRKCALLCMQYE